MALTISVCVWHKAEVWAGYRIPAGNEHPHAEMPGIEPVRPSAKDADSSLLVRLLATKHCSMDKDANQQNRRAKAWCSGICRVSTSQMTTTVTDGIRVNSSAS